MNNTKFSALILLLFFSLAPQLAEAQWLGGTSQYVNTYRYGRVGIGYSSNSGINDKLSVKGSIGTNSDLNINGDIKGQAEGHASFTIYSNKTTSDNYLKFYGASSSYGVDLKYGNRLFFFNDGGNEVMRIDNSDKVIIGGTGASSPPAGYRLAVKEGIITQQVRVVGSSVSWSDYVFADNYRLTPLAEVEAHIKQHQHLPNVPSAQEIKEKGVGMVEMDATLLRQIEELWLHTIALKKENEALKVQIQELQSK